MTKKRQDFLIMKNLSGLKKAVRRRMDSVPLWAEFTLFLTVILILLTLVLSWTVIKKAEQFILENHVKTEQRLLNLKMANLEEYLDTLSSFAILPIYDSSFYSALQTGGDLSDEVTENLRSAVRTYFYSRRDLRSYHVYLLKHNLAIGRNYNQEGIRIYPIENMEDSDIYLSCRDSGKHYAFFPSEHPDVLFKFVHSIIKIENRNIVALTELETDLSGIEYLAAQSVNPGEILNLYNTNGELLYTNAKGEMTDAVTALSPRENRELFFFADTDREVIHKELLNTDYLASSVTGADEELVLVSLVPVSDILSSLRSTRQTAVIISLVFLVFAVVTAYVLIRYLSAPLSALVKVQESFGEGAVTDVNLGRSRESAELSRSFNRMTKRIDTLLKENYAAELNEKNARLAALEAQINPHFLYNTLQAIGSEALLNDQTELYDMLTSLASNLRYSIKGPNVVELKDELQYVDNYIMLQKIRMEDRLEVRKNIDPEALCFRVPKLCIQTLVENSILHGLGGGKESVGIELTVSSGNGNILIRVRDDGAGIDEEELGKIREHFRSQTLSDSNQRMGLANLYNRLLLLYGEETELKLESEVGEASYTTVTLILPLEKNGPEEKGRSGGAHA